MNARQGREREAAASTATCRIGDHHNFFATSMRNLCGQRVDLALASRTRRKQNTVDGWTLAPPVLGAPPTRTASCLLAGCPRVYSQVLISTRSRARSLVAGTARGLRAAPGRGGGLGEPAQGARNAHAHGRTTLVVL